MCGPPVLLHTCSGPAHADSSTAGTEADGGPALQSTVEQAKAQACREASVNPSRVKLEINGLLMEKNHLPAPLSSLGLANPSTLLLVQTSGDLLSLPVSPRPDIAPHAGFGMSC